MTGLSIPTPVIVAALAVLGLVLFARRAGAKAGGAKADAAHRRTGVSSLAGRVIVNAALIVGAQWTVLALAQQWWWVLAALAVPALCAAFSLTRAMTVTTLHLDEPRRGRR